MLSFAILPLLGLLALGVLGMTAIGAGSQLLPVATRQAAPTAGLLAAMAIPAFQKVRTSSQDKAVLNNARQLAAAADQYFLENGVTTAASISLIGATNYVKAVNTVARETYPTNYTQGITITISGLAGARTITYAP